MGTKEKKRNSKSTLMRDVLTLFKIRERMTDEEFTGLPMGSVTGWAPTYQTTSSSSIMSGLNVTRATANHAIRKLLKENKIHMCDKYSKGLRLYRLVNTKENILNTIKFKE